MAYLVEKQSVEVAAIDLMGTDFHQDLRQKFEASTYFRSAVIRDLDGPRDLLVAGALLVRSVGGRLERITVPARRQASVGARLLRLLLEVKDTAPLGERTILEAAPISPSLVGTIQEVVEEGRSGLPGSSAPGSTSIQDPGKIFIFRADSNHDAVVDIGDPVHSLNFLFQGGPAPPCMDAADANDDGLVDIADPIFTLSFLFLGGSAPPAPGAACGFDLTVDGLACGVGCF
ncbi:MAG: hypothetical protein HY721_22275 [Planctomycetes bacterium]|nr:hypothetical protein [Planctomycetota bacterium]